MLRKRLQVQEVAVAAVVANKQETEVLEDLLVTSPEVQPGQIFPVHQQETFVDHQACGVDKTRPVTVVEFSPIATLLK